MQGRHHFALIQVGKEAGEPTPSFWGMPAALLFFHLSGRRRDSVGGEETGEGRKHEKPAQDKEEGVGEHPHAVSLGDEADTRALWEGGRGGEVVGLWLEEGSHCHLPHLCGWDRIRIRQARMTERIRRLAPWPQSGQWLAGLTWMMALTEEEEERRDMERMELTCMAGAASWPLKAEKHAHMLWRACTHHLPPQGTAETHTHKREKKAFLPTWQLCMGKERREGALVRRKSHLA